MALDRHPNGYTAPPAGDVLRKLRARFLALWTWEPTSWGIPRGLAAFLAIFAAGMTIVSLLGDQGLVAYWLLQSEKRSLQETVSALEQREADLLREIDALRSSPGYIEQVARRKLGFVKPGEVIVQLPPEGREE